jgi:hypothetical protein
MQQLSLDVVSHNAVMRMLLKTANSELLSDVKFMTILVLIVGFFPSLHG